MQQHISITIDYWGEIYGKLMKNAGIHTLQYRGLGARFKAKCDQIWAIIFLLFMARFEASSGQIVRRITVVVQTIDY